jgi:hypothetical protein
VIFRTLFSIPIEHEMRPRPASSPSSRPSAQPADPEPRRLLPLPRWMPRLHRRETRDGARIRALIGALVAARAEDRAGTAPDDLATKIMTTPTR